MFFDQFHETKSRHLSSEPLTALKKQLFKFSWNWSKKFTLTQNFAFYEFKCYFVITPTFFECLHFEIIKSVYSEPVFMIWQKSISYKRTLNIEL